MREHLVRVQQPDHQVLFRFERWHLEHGIPAARAAQQTAARNRRDQRFEAGCVLLTGTGIVPPSDFTLEDGDVVAIRIDGLGLLENPIHRHARTN